MSILSKTMPRALTTPVNLSLLFSFLLLCGCGSGSTTLPEAPPPYPNFPVPFQPGMEENRPFSESKSVQPYKPITQGSNFENPYAREINSQYSSYTPPKNLARYTIQANANLWLLVQDPSGNELDWLKMKPGDRTPLSHRGPLTLTCSSGNDIEIYDQQGKRIDVPEGSGGISIVRLQ